MAAFRKGGSLTFSSHNGLEISSFPCNITPTMLKRIILAGLIGWLLCGPAPAQGARELTDIAIRRSKEWTTFAHSAHLTWRRTWDDAHHRLARR